MPRGAAGPSAQPFITASAVAEASAIGADESTEEPAAGLAEQRCRPVKIGGASEALRNPVTQQLLTPPVTVGILRPVTRAGVEAAGAAVAAIDAADPATEAGTSQIIAALAKHADSVPNADNALEAVMRE